MHWDRFVLVDCAADPQLHRALVWHAEQADLQHRSLFERQPEAEHAHAAPWLMALPVETQQRDLMSWLGLIERCYPCLSWLASEAPFDPLFGHLEAQLDAEMPDTGPALLRFFDPRVWVRLQRILNPDQALALMGPVLEWQVTLNRRPLHVRRDDLACMAQEQDAHAQADA